MDHIGVVPIKTQGKNIFAGRKNAITLVALAFIAGALAGCVDSDQSSESGTHDDPPSSHVTLILTTLESDTNEKQWTINVAATSDKVDIDSWTFSLTSEIVADSSEWFMDGFRHGNLSFKGAYFDLEDEDMNPLCYRMIHVDKAGDELLAPGDHLVLDMAKGSWCIDAEDADFDDLGPITGELELNFHFRPSSGQSSGKVSHSF